MGIFYILLVITLLFALVLVFKHFSNNKICAICAGISLTWIGFLVLYKTDRFHDPVILALLIGQSIAGLFYLGERKLPKSLRIFSLPYFISLTALSYVVITGKTILPAMLLALGLWLAAWLVFSYRNDPGKAPLANAVMNCCEDD